jgi:ribosomal protein L14/predicted esterase
MKVKLYLLQRISLFIFFLIVFQSSLFSQQVAKTIPNSTSPDGLIGFLEFRPSDYGTQLHPLIIFLHGIGERGNGTSQINAVTSNAIPKFCAAGATMRFTVGGQTSSFVVLSPQLSVQYGGWPTFYVKEMIKYAKANLQIDPNRIYVTGLSLGGGGIWNVITDAPNGDYSFDGTIAAAAPVCGTQEETDANVCSTIAANHLPVWAFHSMDDGTVGVGATQHAEILMSWCAGINPPGKFTYYQSGGHGGAWINAYDTGHITRTVNGGGSFTANPNLYEWFLSNTRSAAQTNTPPLANAGAAQTITLPLSTVTLTGSGTGTNGATISSYSWAKTSGPSTGTISLPLLNTTTVTGLVQGTYVFTLTVTDNHGLISSSNVTITVNPLVNQSPVANAGSNINITLPTSNTTLNGSASSDPDGTISTYAWSKTSGPAFYTIANAGSVTTVLSNLTQGTYVFTLKVTDNGGATATSTVTVTVNAAPNQAPVANAGSNINITLPTNNTTLNGSASSDPDGTISTYAWSKTSGPASYSISNAGGATPAVSNLAQGVYVFTLQVTDNGGATATSTVTVTVNAAPNQAPVANAGSNISITLPTNNTTLNGSASSDPDGTISTYAWSKTSGPASYTISNAGSATTALSNLAQGVYVFVLQVTDNGGATATSTVTVTVNAAPNQSPVANAGSNISITLPTNNTTLNGSASSDPDGTISTYTWSKTSGPASFSISNAGSATTALSNLAQGVYVFTLQVTDNSGATASSTITVTVNAAATPPPVNQAPVANAGSNISITLPINNTILDGSASSDPDGTISAYIWSKTSGPASYSIANAGGATPAVSNLAQGVYVFTLQVTDNSGATASSTVTVTVNAAATPPPPVNQAPVANAGSNINITLPTNNITLDGSASSDPDGTISTYAWSKTSGPASYSISNAGGATPAVSNLAQGVYVFTLQVTDNGGATASSSVTVTVNAAATLPPVNQAPISNAGSNISITLPTNNITLDGSASSDPDGTISTYAWSKTSGPVSYSISNGDAAITSVSALTQGVYVFTLQVTDNSGATASSTVTVTVNAAATPPPPVNQPPVANAGNNISITLPTNNTTLNGSASSDPDGTISTYAWSKTSGPASYSIANAGGGATTAVTSLTQGVYVFTLQVTDNSGATASSTVTVTVNPAPNQPPVANAGTDVTITLPVNTTNLDGSGSSDPDGTIATYSWNKISGPGAITIVNSNTAAPTVIGLLQGQYVFELTVTDNDGAVATDQVTVTVNPEPNKAPVANAGKDTSVALPVSSVMLSGTGSADADGNITVYSWKEISGPSAVVILQAGSVATEANGMVEGDYVFELQVTDNAGATSTARVKVSVINNFRYSQFFKLYPNPATSIINFQFIDDKTGKLAVAAYDASGRLVINEEISKDQSLLTKEINISKLKPGMYYLEIRHADGTKLIRPFVKQ